MVSGGIKRGEQHDNYPLLFLNSSSSLILACMLVVEMAAYVQSTHFPVRLTCDPSFLLCHRSGCNSPNSCPLFVFRCWDGAASQTHLTFTQLLQKSQILFKISPDWGHWLTLLQFLSSPSFTPKLSEGFCLARCIANLGMAYTDTVYISLSSALPVISALGRRENTDTRVSGSELHSGHSVVWALRF